MSPCVPLRAAGETANPCLHFHNSLHILSECSRVPGEWPGAVTRGAGERSQDTASRVTRVTRVTGRSHAVITTHISRDTILGSRGGGGFIFSRNMQTTVDNLHTLEDCSTSCCSASHQYHTSHSPPCHESEEAVWVWTLDILRSGRSWVEGRALGHQTMHAQCSVIQVSCDW